MPGYLKAICKALSMAAGPLGFPGHFAVSLYDDSRVEERERRLKILISEGHTVTKKSIEEIYEIKNGMTELRTQLINGIAGIKKILSQNRELLNDPQAIQDELPILINTNQKVVDESGFVTKKMLMQELSFAYSVHPNKFIQALDLAGFDTSQIPHGQANDLKTTVFYFLDVCRTRYGLNKQEKIFSALSEENPNSEALRVYATLLKERKDYG